MGFWELATFYVLWTRDGRNWVLGWYWGFPRVEFHKIWSQGGDLKPVRVSRQDARAGNLRKSKAHRSSEGASNGPWGVPGLKEHLRTRGRRFVGLAHPLVWRSQDIYKKR